MSQKKTNPAADPRRMRRVIAEDPEWNLETVPPLVDSCVQHIVDNFHEHPILAELTDKHRKLVLSKLSTSLPLKVTGPLIADGSGYWERCCRARWELCNVADYDLSWKRMFFERNAEEALESFVPEQSDIQQLVDLLILSAPFVKRLNVKQLLPPPRDKILVAVEDEGDGLSEDAPLKPYNDHLDFGMVFKHLHQLQELHLTYGVLNCGMNFEWNLFECTLTDCQQLSRAVKTAHALTVLRLHHSKLSDERGRMIVAHLLDHPSLTTLDLSYNKLSDGTGRALGKLLNGHGPALTHLNASSNAIGREGGNSIGHALQNNTTLTHLNLRMNRLGDEGAQPVLKALLKNSTITTLNLSSNDIGEPTAPALSEMLIANSTLTSLDITCNKIGEAGGKQIQEGMEENATLMTFDLRLTEISEESEICINQIIAGNQERQKQT